MAGGRGACREEKGGRGMKVVAPDAMRLDASVVAIGAFDGVHRGHQEVLRRSRLRAWSLDVPLVVYTFDPPPRVYFQGVRQLTSLEEKLRRISAFLPDVVVVARFDRAYASRSAKVFIRELFGLGAREVFVGEDFRFGRGRRGDVELLGRYFWVHVVEAVGEGERISSSRIRELLAVGREEEAVELLGWSYGG